MGVEQRFIETYADAIPFDFGQPERIRIEPSARLGRKRILDVAASALLLVLLAPLFILIAIAIRLDSKGPALFRQTRLGLGGRPFEILKFRTMTVLENGDVIRQATRHDPRVTRIGWFLRRTSLDELPQLINVLRGEMSLVGPRPHAKAHDLYYGSLIELYWLRQRVKPGITGWAQVNGHRGETPTLDSMQARIDFDLWYVAHAGIGFDIEILFRTLLVPFRQRNAH